MSFFQKAPILSNLYQQDLCLQREAKHRLGIDFYSKWLDYFNKMGEDAAQILPVWLHEAENNPPKHVPYDAWGQRVDEVLVSQAWEELKAFSACKGIVSVGYNGALQGKQRLVQAILLHLFSASSATYSCPLAMTDAAAKVLMELAPMPLKERLVPRLLSNDPSSFITSGQWMTERKGGSDISGSETIAKYHSQNGQEEIYALWGVKWFTSATTSEMALTLARIENEAGLTLFCVELKRKENSGIQGVLINRLKDKLGTKALPTAELTLNGVLATRIGDINRGVANISGMLNVTRYYNAVASSSLMGLSTLLVKEYGKIRKAFQKPLQDHILFQNSIDFLESTYAGALVMSLEVADLLGKYESNLASKEEITCLRVLVPIAKLLLGKQAVAHASETLECFGGAGYIEDTGLPRLLRDAQVLPIWEGCTNVLSLDVLRAEKKSGAFNLLVKNIQERLEKPYDINQELVSLLLQTTKQLQWQINQIKNSDEKQLEKFARRFSITAGLLMQGVLLAETQSSTMFENFVENNFCGPLGILGIDAQSVN